MSLTVVLFNVSPVTVILCKVGNRSGQQRVFKLHGTDHTNASQIGYMEGLLNNHTLCVATIADCVMRIKLMHFSDSVVCAVVWNVTASHFQILSILVWSRLLSVVTSLCRCKVLVNRSKMDEESKNLCVSLQAAVLCLVTSFSCENVFNIVREFSQMGRSSQNYKQMFFN